MKWINRCSKATRCDWWWLTHTCDRSITPRALQLREQLTVEQLVKALEIKLPAAPRPVANYVPAVVSGKLLAAV